MKTKILSAIFCMALLLGACKKNDQSPNNGSGGSGSNNPTPTTGTLYFKNTQSDPYTIFLDGVNQGVLTSNSTSGSYTVSSGISHAVKAEQYSGYILYPTIYTGTVTLNAGSTVTWSF